MWSASAPSATRSTSPWMGGKVRSGALACASLCVGAPVLSTCQAPTPTSHCSIHFKLFCPPADPRHLPHTVPPTSSCSVHLPRPDTHLTLPCPPAKPRHPPHTVPLSRRGPGHELRQQRLRQALPPQLPGGVAQFRHINTTVLQYALRHLPLLFGPHNCENGGLRVIVCVCVFAGGWGILQSQATFH